MPKQGKVRKGTHSCRECRRRKVKCVLAFPTDVKCVPCQRRGSTCTSQSVVESSITALDAREYGSGGHDQTTIITDDDWDVQSATLASAIDGRAEVGEQYPADRIQLPPTPITNDVSPAEIQMHSTITQELLRSFPKRADIEILQHRVDRISATCFQFDYKAPLSTLHGRSTKRTAKLNLLTPESNPVLLAKQMLLFATALQYIPPTETTPGLDRHHHRIMDDLARAAIRTVAINDSLLGSLEGLEIIILEAFYHTDSGDIRQAWITMRRAVMAAQLLGLHRCGHHRYKVIDPQNDIDPETIWSSIVYMERVVSLLSGLPTSTSGIILARQESQTDVSSDRGLLTHLGNVAGKILERNQIEVPQQALDLTKNIDEELLRISESLPPAFWRPTEFSGLSRDSLDTFDEIRRVFDHSSYYTLIIQLHMPHMLCPSHSTQRMYSKMACVNASREILTRQIALRIFNPVTACCRMNDFMALIAGMTLMLAHATSHCDKSAGNVLAHQRLGDRAMVQRALECITFISEAQEDQLAVRCAALLKDLLIIEEGAARKQDQDVNRSHVNPDNAEDSRDMLITRAPFFGGMKISRGGIAVVAPLRAEHNQGSGDISIGGIGSIRVNNPRSNISTPVEWAPGVARQQTSVNPDTSYLESAIQQDFITQQDQIFSDIATGFDDWSVLGMDTAFFESLMQGSGNTAFDISSTN